MVVVEGDDPDGMPVDMNASLLRQIKAADKKYWKFQRVLLRMYTEAYEHPDTVRRVR
jgi:hypothetical protein